jgi:hypothetical protein
MCNRHSAFTQTIEKTGRFQNADVFLRNLPMSNFIFFDTPTSLLTEVRYESGKNSLMAYRNQTTAGQ